MSAGSRRMVMISIHAPREGSDYRRQEGRHQARGFQSTLPARGATGKAAGSGRAKVFQSTLPARGATHGLWVYWRGLRHFNPRSPRGERPRGSWTTWLPENFNPRSPRGERRQPGLPQYHGHKISIHAPREGSDGDTTYMMMRGNDISIHAPREGSDRRTTPTRSWSTYFNPRSPRGERR